MGKAGLSALINVMSVMFFSGLGRRKSRSICRHENVISIHSECYYHKKKAPIDKCATRDENCLAGEDLKNGPHREKCEETRKYSASENPKNDPLQYKRNERKIYSAGEDRKKGPHRQ